MKKLFPRIPLKQDQRPALVTERGPASRYLKFKMEWKLKGNHLGLGTPLALDPPYFGPPSGIWTPRLGMPRMSHDCLSFNDQKAVPPPLLPGAYYYLILERSLHLAGPGWAALKRYNIYNERKKERALIVHLDNIHLA